MPSFPRLISLLILASVAACQGAEVEWWSLRPLVRPTVPSGPHENLIDRFIGESLSARHWKMAPEADARILCRRLYFDLIGLPPNPSQMEEFLAASVNNAETAYLQLVETLLASPRHGERWARHWLDVVHYGDTHGYDKDKMRPNAWPYRDYVIRALNEDKPYARFVQEQIAGEILFPDTQDGIEALGFLAAGPWDFIGHAELPEEKTDGKIARHLDRDDMVANTIGTFCSVTVHCAQCHNHKFDPISQEDYYSLQAVFSALDRTDKSYDIDPAIAQQRSTLKARKQSLLAQSAVLADRLKLAGGAELANLDRDISNAEKAASQGRRPEYGYHGAISQEQEKPQWVQIDLGESVALDRVVLAGCWDDFNGIGAGFGFPVRYRIEAGNDAAFGGQPLVVVAHDLEDQVNPGTAPLSFPAQGVNVRYLRITATKLAPRQQDFIFALSEVQAFNGAGINVAMGKSVTSLSSIEAPVRWSRKNLTDDIYPAKTGGGKTLESLREEKLRLVAHITNAAQREERRTIDTELETTERQLRSLLPERVIYAGTILKGEGNFRGSGGTPRPIFLLARGQVTQPGKQVTPGTLSAITQLKGRFESLAKEGDRRAALARWLTDPQNPLTWRSIVNRVWQYHFGHGLADTPNDFGHMGTLPTHPALLDWLAVEFRNNGGSLKQLHRLIVTSAAYRQSSSANNPDAARLDANNTLLWRQNRRKLEAEAVRDSVLVVSGKLDLTMGGPGWQDFVLEHPEHSPHYEYHLANPADPKTWRRSIYRFIVRSQMQPFMTSLDCADPSMRVDKRNESVSAPQALALLNNGFMLVQSEQFAQRLEAASSQLPAQIELAFRLSLGRLPTAKESSELENFAKQHGLPNLCRVLFNLNEFTFID